MKLQSVGRRAVWLGILVMGFLGIGFGQDLDWKWQNPTPQGHTLNDVFFATSQIGWAVGWKGTILKTDDAGAHWKTQISSTEVNLNSVFFLNSMEGWVVGGSTYDLSTPGVILKTTDGGNTWINQNVFGTGYTSVFFIDSLTGWIAKSYMGWPHNAGVLKTTDGGTTWQSPTLPSINNPLYGVSFADSLHGIAVGLNSVMMRTSNGGTSWQMYHSSPTGPWLQDVCFGDALTAWAVGNDGKIHKTTNGGSSWSAQTSGTTGWLQSVCFVDNQTGWVTGLDGKILKTTNGGTTWQTQMESNTALYSIHFSDALHGLAVGALGKILRTGNGGNTWEEASTIATIQHLSNVHFSSPKNGRAIGSNGCLLKTQNGGQNWFSQGGDTVAWITKSHFLTDQVGWGVGNTGTIRHTGDGGINWAIQPSGTTQNLRSVHFINSQNGWAVGSYGTAMKTSNSGSSWVSQAVSTKSMEDVFFIDSLNGWIAGESGLILHTENGGDSWSIQNNVGATPYLREIFFKDVLHGWALGDIGTLLRTSDGGNTWTSSITNTSSDLCDVYFLDSLSGWVASNDGRILKTSDGGITWLSQITPTILGIKGIYFTDPLHGWAVGYGGTILTTTTNDYVFPEEPHSVISGTLFTRVGNNCTPSSIPAANRVVKANPGPYYGFSSANGEFNLRIPLSDTALPYTIQPVGLTGSAFQISTVCPPSGQLSVLVDTLPDTLTGNNFGLEISPCHQLNVEIASNRRRRCLHSTTTVSYVNQGSLSALDAYVLVEFPHWVRPISASIPHTALNDSIWQFNLDTVKAGHGRSFTIVDSVLCSHPEIRNLTQCTKATIYPAPDCPSPNWSGAEISASGQCNNGWVQFTIRNKTSVVMPDSVTYWIYLDSIQVKTGKVKLAAGDSAQLWVETIGMTAHLSVNQVLNHPTEIFVTATVEGCGSTQPPTVSANNFSKVKTPNSKTHCLPICDSYDPNDKQAFPIGFTANNVVKPGTEMEYLVRFQNTGNDTAYTVYVIDSLDNNLNVESLEIGAVSHPYELTLQTTRQGRNFLRFQFNQIMLPDSNTNELLSHGFLQYRISPKAGLALGSQAKNEAEIYFDFNLPVITNRTLTTFDTLIFTDTTLNDNVLNEQPVAPTLSTTLLSGITLNSAVSGGMISTDGGPDVTARGVVWNTAPNPTIALTTKTMDGSGTGTFTSNLTGLQLSTAYYVRAYATNSIGTSYGEERQFTTNGGQFPPTVITGNVNNISLTTAEVTHSEVTGDGGATVSQRGVCWSTSPSPTIDLPTKTMDGSEMGDFSSELTGLSPGTTYHFRAYATNIVGTSYGEELQFTTLFISVDEEIKHQAVTVFPNPFSHQVTFSSKAETPVSFSITDVYGREVIRQKFVRQQQVDLSHLASGIYYLMLPQYHQSMKLVKE